MYVVVKDQLPGTGKSSRMIEEINNSDADERWIVVTPFLKECHRYAGTIIDPDSDERQLPLRDDKGNVIYTGEGCNKSGRQFHHPVSGYRSKVENISRLVQEGRDIVTTHAALKLFTPDTVKDIKDAGYRLVIDEELECIRPLPVMEFRRKILLSSGVVYEDEVGLLRWNPDYAVNLDDAANETEGVGHSWEVKIKALCDNGSLVLIGEKEGEKGLFMWEYPIEFLKAFDRIDILTYMFKGSMFEKYLDYYGVMHTTEYGIQLPEDPFKLITLVDNPKMNRIGERDSAFSATDSKRITKDSVAAKTIRANLGNFFNNSTYGKSVPSNRLWTCLSDAKPVFKGSGYTKNHIAQNVKAVNDYVDTSQLAYVYNSYMHPEPFKYLKNRGEEYAPDQERYALTEMIQWIYRSQIRRGDDINLYVPSGRMRNLLIDWMEGQHKPENLQGHGEAQM